MYAYRSRGNGKLVALILVLVLAVAGIWILKNSTRTERGPSLASMVPEDTLCFVAYRGIDEIYEKQFQPIRAENPDIEQEIGKLMQEVLAEPLEGSGVEADSLMSAAKGLHDIELALTRFDRSGPTVVGLATVTNPIAGWDLFKQVLAADLLEPAEEHGGYKLYKLKKELDLGFEGAKAHLFMGLLGTQAVFALANDVTVLNDVIDAASAPMERTLANEETYRRLAAEAPENVTSWVYLPAKPLLDLAQRFAPPHEWQSIKESDFAHGLSTLVAISSASWMDGDWSEGWFRIHTDGTTPWYQAARTPASPRKLLAAVPGNAVMAVDLGLGDVKDLWDRGYAYSDKIIEVNWLDSPNGQERMRRDKEERDRFVREEFPEQMGFSLLDDLIPALGDELAVAVFPGNQQMPVQVAGLLSIRDAAKAHTIEQALKERMGRGLEWDEQAQGDITLYAVAGSERGAAPPFAYALADDLLVVATSREVVQACVDARKGTDNMAASAAYKPSFDRLPKDLSWIFTMDVGGYFDMILAMSPMPPDSPEMEVFNSMPMRDSKLAYGVAMDEKSLSIQASMPMAETLSSAYVTKVLELIRDANAQMGNTRQRAQAVATQAKLRRIYMSAMSIAAANMDSFPQGSAEEVLGLMMVCGSIDDPTVAVVDGSLETPARLTAVAPSEAPDLPGFWSEAYQARNLIGGSRIRLLPTECSFVGFGRKIRYSDDEAVLLREKTTGPDGKYEVIYADGRVASLTEAELQALVRQGLAE